MFDKKIILLMMSFNMWNVNSVGESSDTCNVSMKYIQIYNSRNITNQTFKNLHNIREIFPKGIFITLRASNTEDFIKMDIVNSFLNEHFKTGPLFPPCDQKCKKRLVFDSSKDNLKIIIFKMFEDKKREVSVCVSGQEEQKFHYIPPAKNANSTCSVAAIYKEFSQRNHFTDDENKIFRTVNLLKKIFPKKIFIKLRIDQKMDFIPTDIINSFIREHFKVGLLPKDNLQFIRSINFFENFEGLCEIKTIIYNGEQIELIILLPEQEEQKFHYMPAVRNTNS